METVKFLRTISPSADLQGTCYFYEFPDGDFIHLFEENNCYKALINFKNIKEFKTKDEAKQFLESFKKATP